MNVLTTRSGRVLHAVPSCSALAHVRVLELDEADAPARATRCPEPKCSAAFLRKAA